MLYFGVCIGVSLAVRGATSYSLCLESVLICLSIILDDGMLHVYLLCVLLINEVVHSSNVICKPIINAGGEHTEKAIFSATLLLYVF